MSNEPKADLAGVDELVGRLKLIASKLMGRMVVDGVEVNATCDQAADRITALSAEVAVAQDYKDCGCSYDHPDDICLGHMKLFERRHAALEAELAEKDALLRKCGEGLAGPNAWLERWASHVGGCHGGSLCQCGLTLACLESATTLAKIKDATDAD